MLKFLILTAQFISCGSFHFQSMKTTSKTISTSSISATSIESYDLEKDFSGYAREYTKCNNDVVIETIYDNTIKPSTKLAPIIFIHGSYHASWCWAEHFMPYFAQAGYRTYSVSLRGTSKSPLPSQNTKTPAIKIEDHVDDLTRVINFVQQSNKQSLSNPIVIGHSFGGLAVQKLMESENIRAQLSAIALLCSVPPSGNGPMTSRFVKSRFIVSLKIVYGFVLKKATVNLGLCRELFFDESVCESDIKRYMEHFRQDSEVGLDVGALGKVLPSVVSIGAGGVNGRAFWLDKTSDSASSTTTVTSSNINNSNNSKGKNSGNIPRRLVIGGGKDFIVDREGVEETARFLGVEPVIIPDMYHDVMLGPKWKITADIILDFLRSSNS